MWFESKAEESKTKRIGQLEKEFDEQKKKEKKKLDAEIKYDSWVQNVLERDLITKELNRRKKQRKEIKE